ncbi:MAG: hypothetical protein ACU85U_19040 [Gammaproteobacteria bacterium]|jgi:hypothetical protein
MSFIADTALQQRFVEGLNANEAFNTQAFAFDGSVLLEVNTDRLWLKIYKGRVIDHEPAASAFGYTFKFSGSAAAWQLLLDGKRRWADLTFPGTRYFADDPNLATVGQAHVEIATEGNLLEAARLTEAMFLLAYTLRDAAQS